MVVSMVMIANIGMCAAFGDAMKNTQNVTMRGFVAPPSNNGLSIPCEFAPLPIVPIIASKLSFDSQKVDTLDFVPAAIN